MIQIIQADVMDGLAQIPDQSVQCVVTSPPYWGLRDYGTGRWEGGDPDCEHERIVARGGRGGSGPNSKNTKDAYPSTLPANQCSKCGAVYTDNQIGLEKTPEEYVAKMVEVFREVRRVLRDDGTVWLNLGDGYNAQQGKGFPGTGQVDLPETSRNTKMKNPDWLKPKDLVGIPWRVAFALQADGWYLRSDIIWSKPNPMPESVTDRPTKAHEYVFLLTKKARYFYDADAVREPHQDSTFMRAMRGNSDHHKNLDVPGRSNHTMHEKRAHGKGMVFPSSGRNRRTVWEIATQPFPAAHFATFPEALVEPCIKAGTSERGCCSVCGAPWVRVVDVSYERPRTGGPQNPERYGDGDYVNNSIRKRLVKIPTTTGFQPACTCSADTIPCTVLDPFGGSGTVGKVARDLNRKAILIEINPEYIKIARERLRLNEQLIFTE